MRIVLHSRFPTLEGRPRGGVETATLNLLRGLKQIGFDDLHVVTLERGINRQVVEKRELATIHRLPIGRTPMIVDVFVGPGRRRLKSYIESLQPQIVHFHETHGLGLWNINAPSIFTVHGFDSLNLPTERRFGWRIRSKLWACAETHGLRDQTHIISIAPYVTEQVSQRTEAKIFEISNAITAQGFEIPRTPVSGQVFYAGWINPRKNAVGLVRAFELVKGKYPSATLRIAGEFSDSAYRRSLELVINECGLAESVSLLGRLDASEIQVELGQASVFALPSFQENAPMVVSEALAAGVPVVTSNVCGMPYMVDDGRTGFLTDPNSITEIAEKIIEILTSKKLETEMSRYAKLSAQERYHPDAVARKTIQAYEATIRAFHDTEVADSTRVL